jgi:hypothetical protein
MDRSRAVRLSGTTVATLTVVTVLVGRSVGLFGVGASDPAAAPAAPVVTVPAAVEQHEPEGGEDAPVVVAEHESDEDGD